LDYANANRTFVEGKAAMYPMGSWFIQQASKEANFDVGIFLMPRDDGEAIVPAVVQGSVVVLASSEHPDLSMEIAKWMTTSPVYMKMLMEADAVFPMLKGMSVEDYNADVSDLYLEGLSYFNDDKGKAVSSFCWTNDVNSPLPGMKAEIYSSYQNIASGADVKAEMEHLDKVWEDTAKRLSQ
jgi:ABC-type glycerol-3-phosphate transport system substrate-binding protein